VTLYTATYREIRTEAVYNLKSHSDRPALTNTLWARERPIQDLRPMSDDRCCYGNIHRCRYRCRCGVPQSPSDII